MGISYRFEVRRRYAGKQTVSAINGGYFPYKVDPDGRLVVSRTRALEKAKAFLSDQRPTVGCRFVIMQVYQVETEVA